MSNGRYNSSSVEPRTWFGRHLWWSAGLLVLGVVLAVAGMVLIGQTVPDGCRDFHLIVQLAGSDRRLGQLLAGCGDLRDFRATIWRDFVFLAGYGLAGSVVVAIGWERYTAVQTVAIKRVVRWLPLAAACLDAFENGLTILLVSPDTAGRLHYANGSVGGTAIAVVAWAKWFTIAAAAVAVVMAISAWINFRRRVPARPRPRTPARPVNDEPKNEGRRDIGVACSGGGIRAAGYTIGALEALETAGLMGRVHTVSAVSGGGYAATAWLTTRATSSAATKDKAAKRVSAWLCGPISPHSPVSRQRYLSNAPGGLERGLVLAAGIVVLNLLGLASLVLLAAWPLGRVLSSNLVQPDLRVPAEQLDVSRLDLAPPELAYPALVLVAVGIVLFVLSLRRAWFTRFAVLALAFAAVLALTLIAVPAVIILLRVSAVGDIPPAAASGFSLAGAALAVLRIVRQPVTSRLLSIAPRLGGILLIVAALLFAGTVISQSASRQGLFGSWVAPAVAGGYAIVFALILNTNVLSLQLLFRARLRSSFGLVSGADHTLASPPWHRQVAWADIEHYPIRYMLCCTQASSRPGLSGFRARSFVISPQGVAVDGRRASGDADVPALDSYLQQLPRDMQHLRSVVAWSGVSGAAFASATGRTDLGTTNALLAATAVDLGTWLPNPDYRGRRRHLRLSYLMKEILGWFNPDDAYTFLTDGGHWDNLGLVELLRTRPTTIICIDASGDPVGSFATLREAAALARLAIVEDDVDTVSGGTVTIDLTALDDAFDRDMIAKRSVWTLPVTYAATRTHAASSGSIVYIKAQRTVDMPVDVARFAVGDRSFPHYSTSDQFLTDDQFENLVQLGRFAGAQAAALLLPEAHPGSRLATDYAESLMGDSC